MNIGSNISSAVVDMPEKLALRIHLVDGDSGIAIDSLTIITVGDRLVCNVGRIIVED